VTKRADKSEEVRQRALTGQLIGIAIGLASILIGVVLTRMLWPRP
jgi:hypothetical protein